jgi:hypothetical protein
MRLPVRVQDPVIELLRTPLPWTDVSERPPLVHAGDRFDAPYAATGMTLVQLAPASRAAVRLLLRRV